MASDIKVNNIKSYTGNTLNLGDTGDTINLTGASFNGTSSVIWDTTAKTSAFTATAGTGFFVDTTSAAITATLPATPSAGDIIAFKDYAGTFGTNSLTIARNGENIQGNANDSLIETDRASVILVYVDATKGWLFTNESNVGDLEAAKFVVATGGTVTTSGDFKIHTFTSSGTFTVTAAGKPSGSNTVDYLVIAAGGGGGGGDTGLDGNGGAGGGGAGGYRESFPNPATGGFPVSAQAYPITVGAGGGGGGPQATGSNGGNSVFSTITATGGGGGGGNISPEVNGSSGGSGGGAGSHDTGGGTAGSGNTPATTPSQGNDGGDTLAANTGGGGGGGAGGAGNDSTNSPYDGANGGVGNSSSITGSAVNRAGGAGGGGGRTGSGGGSGGSGGGGDGGGASATNTPGTVNTGGGGGGAADGYQTSGASGGSGVVIIRYKFQ
jgi:hypothetical protein